MKYKIESENSIYELQDSVRKSISRGWKPLGSPFVKDLMVYQAMIKV